MSYITHTEAALDYIVKELEDVKEGYAQIARFYSGNLQDYEKGDD